MPPVIDREKCVGAAPVRISAIRTFFCMNRTRTGFRGSGFRMNAGIAIPACWTALPEPNADDSPALHDAACSVESLRRQS